MSDLRAVLLSKLELVPLDPVLKSKVREAIVTGYWTRDTKEEFESTVRRFQAGKRKMD